MPQTIYHYTGQDGFLGILESKSLWLSSVRHLNDAAELRYAADLARALLKAAPSERSTPYRESFMKSLDALENFTVFVASFSNDGGDQLSQWRGYSRNGPGYSIGFDLEKLKTLAGRQGYALVKCCYDPEQNQVTLRNVIAGAEASVVSQFSKAPPEVGFMRAFMDVAATMKHPSFKDEQEYRLVAPFVDGRRSVRLRSGKSFLIPYKTLNFLGEGENPITRVYVGPSPHLDLATETVHVHSQHYLTGIEVRSSTVPYRDW